MCAGWLLAETTSVYHQFSRLQLLTQWWHWFLLALICAAITGGAAWLYRRDGVELPRPFRWTLFLLRLAAFAGILFYFLDLEKRTQREVTRPSRVVVLIDTSLSMGLEDERPAGTVRAAAGSGPASGETTTGVVANPLAAAGPAGARRIDPVIQTFQQGQLIEQLRRQHDVVVYRFDQQAAPAEIAAFSTTKVASSDSADPRAKPALLDRQRQTVRLVLGVAALLLAVSLISAAWSWVVGARRQSEDGSWKTLVAAVTLIAAIVVAAAVNLRFPDVSLRAAIGVSDEAAAAGAATASKGSSAADGSADVAAADQPAGTATPTVDWAEQLAPRGSETRLGDAVRFVVDRERGGPIAGVVLITDGRSNAGLDYEEALAAASDAGVVLHTVGLGSDKRPRNVRIIDLEAPPRAYPGDRFTVTGYLQAFGLAGRTVQVELVSQPADAAVGAAGEQFEEDRRVTLGADGEPTTLRFEVALSAEGRRTYRLRLAALPEDGDPRDNERSANVEIVSRKNQVLLLAGGPTRDFSFLRNLLYRDRDTTSHVLLQSGQPGMSQEADEILFEFPSTADELFEYDCIVAFDADWLKLSEPQMELLERWVAEKAGGLILVAGPVHTPRWASRLGADRRIDLAKSLYPVAFYSRGSATISLGRFASESAWPLQFSDDGRNSEFLWLDDDAAASEEIWASFGGVFGYYAVKDPKPGARVFARFSDPSTSIDGELPIYLAGHFYGAGRVFFQASGEIWRLRAVSDGYFETYYTKLIRWASQGRLLRDSTHGTLLVDQDRCLLGDHVVVQAILNDAQHRPLSAPEVVASLLHPDGRRTPLRLPRSASAAREGAYQAQFTATLEGDYRIELPPLSGAGDATLAREVRSRIPALETEQPQRNDPLLKDLAEQTGGAYYVGLTAAVSPTSGAPPLVNRLQPQDQVTLLPGSPDKRFERLLMTWLMGLICGALCLEWLLRRLTRLA